MAIQCNKTGEVHVIGAMKVMYSYNGVFMLSRAELKLKMVEIRKMPPMFTFLVIDQKVLG